MMTPLTTLTLLCALVAPATAGVCRQKNNDKGNVQLHAKAPGSGNEQPANHEETPQAYPQSATLTGPLQKPTTTPSDNQGDDKSKGDVAAAMREPWKFERKSFDRLVNAQLDVLKADDEVATMFTTAENTLRDNFNAQPITWSEDASRKAFAQAKACKWEHSYLSSQKDYPDNLYANSNNKDMPTINVISVMTGWGGEWVGKYPYSINGTDYQPRSGVEIGHWKVAAWKGAKAFGCGYAFCDPIQGSMTGLLAVCMWDMGGPWIGGEDDKNLEAPKDKSQILNEALYLGKEKP